MTTGPLRCCGGGDLPAGKEFADFSGISSGLGVLVVWGLILLVNGFGEEAGWRGCALAGQCSG